MLHYLKYKDINVLVFDVQAKKLKRLNHDYLPFSLQGKTEFYDLIRSFCSGRLLMMNREYCKENLYYNKFSASISKVALTGDMTNITEKESIGDKLYTGELTNKGTRAKCYVRNKNNLFLVKNETLSEISAEILGYHIAVGLNLPCSQYNYIKYLGKDCSVCQIFTSDFQ